MVKGYNRALLTLINCLHTFTWIFIHTFLVASLFRDASQDITLISFYFMVVYTTVLGLALITGPMIKGGYRLRLYRLGLILTFLALSWMMLGRENIIYHIDVYGAILGSAWALKTFSWNITTSEIISKRKTVKFHKILSMAKNGIKIISPVLFGYFLSTDTLGRMILLVLCLIAIEGCLSLFLKNPVTAQKGWFNLRLYLNKTKSNLTIKNLYFLEFFKGFSFGGFFNTAFILYTIYLFKTDFSLGLILSVFNGLSVCIYFIFNRYFARVISELTLIGSLMAVTASILFALYPTQGGFIFYNFLFVGIAKTTKMFCDLGILSLSKTHTVPSSIKNEYFSIREAFFNLGRVFGFAILTLTTTIWGFESLKYCLVMLSLSIVLWNVAVYLLRNNFDYYPNSSLLSTR